MRVQIVIHHFRCVADERSYSWSIAVCLSQVAFWFCSDTALSINYMCQLENHIPWIYNMYSLYSWAEWFVYLWHCASVCSWALYGHVFSRPIPSRWFLFGPDPPLTQFYSLFNEVSPFYFTENYCRASETGIDSEKLPVGGLTGIMFNCIVLVIH